MRLFCLLVLGMIFSGSTLMAQSDSITEIKFTYDDAGSRTNREIIYYESALKGAQVVNIEEEELDPEKGLKVYPNPASHSLYITLNQEAMDEDYRNIILYDNLGKQVKQVLAPQKINEIDVSSLSNGTYILKLTYGHRHKEWIIIKN